jgi:hypothetical protein
MPTKGAAKFRLGQVIARRRYRAGRTSVLLRIGTPQRSGGDYYCAFAIGDDGLHHAYGVDAVQALELALKLAKVHLENHRPKLTFLGGPPGDVGLGGEPRRPKKLPWLESAMDEVFGRPLRKIARARKSKRRAKARR